MRLFAATIRAIYAREALPAPVRWTLCAAAMRDWLALLARSLREHLGDGSRGVVADLVRDMFARRYAVLCQAHPHLPEFERHPRAPVLLMAGLYQLPVQSKRGWLWTAVGGPPRGVAEWWRAARLLRPLSAEDRWRELTVHLGEMLIVVTETLPARLPRARQIVARMCHDLGARYARQMRRAFDLPDDTPVANAIEILRASEYLFRVNPEHESGADESARLGFIDGNACPWYHRPGWKPGHCGIFGQFQAGVCSEFGLRYRLLTTIPKHGGDHCRVEISPIAIRRSAHGPAIQL